MNVLPTTLASTIVGFLGLGCVSTSEDRAEPAAPVSPVTAPFYFESPEIQTDVAAYSMYHHFPETGLAQGGATQVYGVQGRLAITENLGFVINKLAFYVFDPDAGDGSTTAMADFGIGLKYALWRDRPSKSILTIGTGYEFHTGSEKILQGKGEGVWSPYLAFQTDLNLVNLVANFGAILPLSGSEQSAFWRYNLRVDRPVEPWLVPFLEFNGYTVLDEARDNPTLTFEGYDLFNVGSPDGADGDEQWTLAPGIQFPTDVGTFGVAYEFPVHVSDDGFFDWRLTADFTYTF